MLGRHLVATRPAERDLEHLCEEDRMRALGALDALTSGWPGLGPRKLAGVWASGGFEWGKLAYLAGARMRRAALCAS